MYESVGKIALTHVPCFMLIFPLSHDIFLIMLFLFHSVSSTVSLSHQFPSFIRQQSLVFQSLKESLCVFSSNLKENTLNSSVKCYFGCKNQPLTAYSCSAVVFFCLSVTFQHCKRSKSSFLNYSRQRKWGESLELQLKRNERGWVIKSCHCP